MVFRFVRVMCVLVCARLLICFAVLVGCILLVSLCLCWGCVRGFVCSVARLFACWCTCACALFCV